MTFFKRVADRDAVDAAHNAICDAERAYECSYTPADRAVALDDLEGGAAVVGWRLIAGEEGIRQPLAH